MDNHRALFVMIQHLDPLEKGRIPRPFAFLLPIAPRVEVSILALATQNEN